MDGMLCMSGLVLGASVVFARREQEAADERQLHAMQIMQQTTNLMAWRQARFAKPSFKSRAGLDLQKDRAGEGTGHNSPSKKMPHAVAGPRRASLDMATLTCNDKPAEQPPLPPLPQFMALSAKDENSSKFAASLREKHVDEIKKTHMPTESTSTSASTLSEPADSLTSSKALTVQTVSVASVNSAQSFGLTFSRAQQSTAHLPISKGASYSMPTKSYSVPQLSHAPTVYLAVPLAAPQLSQGPKLSHDMQNMYSSPPQQPTLSLPPRAPTVTRSVQL
mmetsp:Transcript_90005/g.160231  ORF Transcript_90005/g.160231 Transcript_90005/m.160231 type:complete len:278 (-) Transcript_90005:171-1004(-)|eukprot:CAMPEP_0197652810 /NCGR_PEP_ID=MMETSP1338-20131121/34673_1 /TAXON_ID=43686 ORGANISM="Pelagodinium beii, Strain RCC1491" /NCGR_SAMPLE_ID=MMETSP1338 /ASSEMBLY_ACC=CAM_ASM_000754 /LENGTH=277 /DNA_ID=CAMNT_0043227759 /DNA_START=128 /DNA_END=961 /DNA_ORIENTATION=-